MLLISSAPSILMFSNRHAKQARYLGNVRIGKSRQQWTTGQRRKPLNNASLAHLFPREEFLVEDPSKNQG